MVSSDNKYTGNDFEDSFWDLDFAKPERKGPFTDGRHSTEAVEVDNAKDDAKTPKMSFMRVPSKLPPAVEITQNINPVKAEKKRSTRIYSDMDAERRLIKDSLEAAEKMGLKTEKTDVSSVPSLDVPSVNVPNIRTGSPVVGSTEIPKRPELYDRNIEERPSVGEQKTSSGDFFDIPIPKFVPKKSDAPAFISGQVSKNSQNEGMKESNAFIPDDEIPYFTEDDLNMPPLEPPPENFDNSIPHIYMKASGYSSQTQTAAQTFPAAQTPHTNKFNQSYNRSGQGAKKTAETSHKPSLLLEYVPEQSLIRKVSVFRWPSSYNFYEHFCRDAAKLFSRKGAECPPIEFFSYIPQYNQLKRAQLDFYLWWRENFRNGVSIEADFSYILLYIYEIINLPELIPPEEGIKLMCRVWVEYRAKYLRLDKYLVEWICDYCLIYNLPCPSAELKSILPVISEKSTLKEFYMSVPAVTEAISQRDTRQPDSPDKFNIKPPADALVSFVSNYDWRTSKFAQDTESDVYRTFDEHISAALDYVQTRCEETGNSLIGGGGKSGDSSQSQTSLRLTRVSRDAFCGSLCAYNIKRRIDVEVLSFSRSHEFRAQITDIVKYSENRIRAHLKIKSRLGTSQLPVHVRGFLDEYFNKHLPMQRKSGSAKNQPEYNEYDKYYEAPKSTLTAESADMIEKASWGTTEMLIRAFNENDIPETDKTVRDEALSDDEYYSDESEYIEGEISFDSPDAPELPDSDTESTVETSSVFPSQGSFTEIHLNALRAASDGSFNAYCREMGLFAETVSAEINDIAIELIGDIVLEESENGFLIIEDYMDDVASWI